MPSSRFLIDRLLRPIDFAAATSIVELGAGTGCITRTLLERMSPECRLTCIEVEEEFAAACSMIDDARLTVHHACAADLERVLRGGDISGVDYIVSSVPLSILDDRLADDILAVAQASLRPGGKFLQYQYSLTYLGKLTALYRDVRWGLTFRNVPPAVVYECRA